LVRRRRYEPLTGAIWAVALVAVQILRWMPGLSNDVNYWLLVNLRFISNSAGPLVFTFGWLALTVIGLIVVVRTFLARQPFHAVITHPNGLGLIKEAGQAPTWYTWGQLSIAVRTHEGVTTSVGVRPPGQREFSITPRALPDFPIFLERLRYFTS
jgi:hypothetical protein